MKYSQTLITIIIIIDDEYESSDIASQKELGVFLVISILIILGTPIYQLLNKLWTSLSLTQKLKNKTRIIGDDLGIK